MDCNVTAVVQYFESTELQALQWTQFGFSLASIIVVIYTFVFHLRKSWFEGVFKETLYALYFFLLWHSVCTGMIQAIHLSTRWTAKTPCDMQIDRKFCILRVFMIFSFPSFVCLHATMAAQRVVTTFSGNQRLHHIVARCCLAITLLSCSTYTLVGIPNYSLLGMTPYCTSYVKVNNNILLTGTFTMMFFDILNVIVAFLLMKYNKRKIRELAESSLEVKFRYRQTLYSIQQMLPIAFFHLFCFTFQYVGFEISNLTFSTSVGFEIGLKQTLPEVKIVALNGFIYMMPYYCLICPSILLFIMIREKRKNEKEMKHLSNATTEETAETHFTTLQSQWEFTHLIRTSRNQRYVYFHNRVGTS